VLEGLLEFERVTGDSPDVNAARLRGQEYLLERRLLHRLSTGEVASPRWLYLAFPNGWHYDVLRALDHLRDAGVGPDERTTEAIDIIESKRDADGRWLARARPSRRAARGPRRSRRSAEPVDHAPSAARAPLGERR